MRGDMVSELGMVALYANQVARAIERMDNRLSKIKKYHAIYPQYPCDRRIFHDASSQYM